MAYDNNNNNNGSGMVRLGGLWKSQMKTGEMMLKGTFGFGANLIILPNKNKVEGSNAPDYIVCVANDNKDKNQSNGGYQKPANGGGYQSSGGYQKSANGGGYGYQKPTNSGYQKQADNSGYQGISYEKKNYDSSSSYTPPVITEGVNNDEYSEVNF